MISTTALRVPDNTAAPVNDWIHQQAVERVATCGAAGPRAIGERLVELDREWDIERVIELEAPLTILAGLGLSATAGRKWLAVPLFASGMLLLHALHGWYPLIPVLRRLGFRTQREIAAERYALKAMRGDFNQVGDESGVGRPRQALDAADPHV